MMVASLTAPQSSTDEAITVDLVSIEWSPRHGAWLVIWCGHLYGGCHYQRNSAEICAASLLEDPDYEEWLAMNHYGVEVQG